MTLKAVPNNPQAPTRYRDETVDALNEVLRRMSVRRDEGWAMDYDHIAGIVAEVRREHQVANS